MVIQRHNILLSQCIQIQQVLRITLEERENYRLPVGDFYGTNLEADIYHLYSVQCAEFDYISFI